MAKIFTAEGFSLIEVILAFAVMMIGILAMLSFQSTMQKQMASLNQSQTFWGVMSTAGLVLQMPDACTDALKNQTLGGPVSVKMPGQPLQAGMKVDGLTITTVDLVSKKPVPNSTDEFFADLEVVGDKSNYTVGAKTLRRSLTLRTKVDASKVILACQGGAVVTAADMLPVLLPAACAAFKKTFDVTTQECVP